MHINWDSNYNLDLLKIYNKLRDTLSDDIPFIKYMNDDWDIPYVSIYSKDIKKISNIPNEILKKWIYMDYRKKEERHKIKMISNVIIIKILTYKYNDIPKYTNFSIDKYGKIQIMTSFIDEYDSNINDIKNVIDKCRDILKNINKILNNKLELPFIEINKNKVILSDNIEISRLFTKIKFSNIIFKNNDLYSMASLFPEHILIKKDLKKINLVQLKYIRISNFENMSDVFEKIHILYKEKMSEIDIINSLEKEFNISTIDATNYLKEWKKKLEFMKQKKIWQNKVVLIL